MPQQILIEDNAYQEKLVTLGGNSIFITLSFNTRDSRWYFDLVDRANNDIISGIKLLPPQNLTSKYLIVSQTVSGNFYCVNTKLDGTDVTRNNFGTDKQFQLWYYTSQEEEDIINELSL